jgi:asparagine synthase (glutamine-hydrolysing)
LADVGLFDVKYISRLVDKHQSGQSDHSAAIWALLMFESFLQRVDPD